MKHLLFLLMLFFWLNPEQGKSQISIHPEVGISYLPFTIYTIRHEFDSRSLDFLFGVSAHLPIYDNFHMKSRIIYSLKKDFDFREPAGFIGNVYYTYIQDHLNVDLSLNMDIDERYFIGIGPSIIRTFDELQRTSYTNKFYDENRFIFALNSGFSVKLDRFHINLMYLRLFRNNDPEKSIYEPIGVNRFDLTVSYHLFGGDKGKKR